MTKKLLLCLTCLVFSFAYCEAQQPDVNWINKHALPVNDTNDSYLKYLQEQLKDNQVCGLAEASHGTHEFFTEKNRIIKYLITHAQYRSVGFEASYAYLVPLNDYVLTGKGNLRELMKPLRLYNTTEIYTLFQLIENYNKTQQAENKVNVFGFDRDYYKPEVDSSARYCLNYLFKKEQQYTNAKATIPVLKHIIDSASYVYGLSDEEVAVLRSLNEEVVKNNLTDANSRLFKKHLSMLYQATFASDPLSRDLFMAENIAAVQQESKAKTIVLGHNVHLAKDTTMAKCRAMGYHLRQKYQGGYYAVGFDTYKGSVTVLDVKDEKFEAHEFEAGPESLSALFGRAKLPAFFLHFTKGTASPLYGIDGYITNIYANWREPRKLPIRPGMDFDALIFIRETTASTELK